jgi:hypothetical protein
VQQQGAATLLITLVLTMSITIVTLAVARTQLVEQRISNNENWNTRLSLQAESGLARGIIYLNSSVANLPWSTGNDNTETSRTTLEAARPDIGIDLMFSRAIEFNRMISVQAVARRNDGSNILARISQYVRLLSVLTPLAESLPPLVVNGCPTGFPQAIDIRPRDADTEQAGISMWSDAEIACTLPGAVDIHNGSLDTLNMDNGLWPLVFSVSREEFILLAEQDKFLPEQDQRYRVAQASGPGSHTWNSDLGSATSPVVLYFPAETGCPVFAPGTTIYGIVCIDSNCPDPIASYNISIIGSLVVNGGLNIANSNIQLNNIQVADNRQSRLDFPILRSVQVPGTWKDF